MKMNKFKHAYGDSIAFFRREFGETVIVAALAFAGMIVLSFVGGMLFPEQTDIIVEQFEQMMLDSGGTDENGNISFAALLLNNLFAMVFAVGYGLIPFIRLSALSLGINGASLGLLAEYYVRKGIPLWKYLVGILPHGIFELTALVLSAAAGLYLCKSVSSALLKKQKGAVSAAVERCGQILTLWILPLVIAAAAIEAYITPALLQAVL